MSRIPNVRFAESVRIGLEWVPAGIRRLLVHVQFVCGVDPVFAGFHGMTETGDGRSYRDTAHCCYPWHLNGPKSRRVTTIMLPVHVGPSVVVHELGHALHEIVGFNWVAAPCSEYAATNWQEAFAEAFMAWRWGPGAWKGPRPDPATAALFDALEAS